MHTEKVYDLLVVGAGIFGLTTALEMKARGYHVAVLDPGPLPHPLAASTDISKIVRMEYGSDEGYMELAERAYASWFQWNEMLGDTFFHDVGVTMLTRAPMAPGEFEYESYSLLRRRAHTPERLSAEAITQRFPAWKAGAFVDGFFHAKGGYVESGRVIEAIARFSQAQGINLYPEHKVEALLKEGQQVRGVCTSTGDTFYAEHVLVAAGAWTSLLVPDIAPFVKATGHPIFHLKPANPDLFSPPNFVVFTADIGHTGWYGFPLHPREGVIKIGNHGVGQKLHPERDKRVVTDSDIEQLRAFLATTFPALQDAPIVSTRRCLYVDTPDGDFWIDRHPQWAGLTVATGDSGHGFKFAPILGELIADAIEGKPNRWLPHFHWRNVSWHTEKKEASRYKGSEN
ncbi:NAD(P)/FAD-dependent oxidoreductase [Ktedonospora formicarum]|uniref:N-methyltryptophan oxidase n=1 Tax=Ktedonospora formicarum TaxID=2778364 RepID=A0A8J3MXB1_9CHLR|nr:FAD-dependent oxidoreductase [Ktedonospora formicarum]GHO48380.1 N-methyltryptophan oxidase [Ktedonospora formicarum]